MPFIAFQQSAFLQSLGWAIANSIWQAALLFLLYKIILSWYSNAPSGFKYNLGKVMLSASFLCFIATFCSRFFYFPGVEEGIMQVRNLGDEGAPERIQLKDVMSPLLITLPYLSMAYIALLLVFSVKFINSFTNTGFLMNHGLLRADAEWKVFVNKISNQLHINKKIEIWFSRNVDVPATIGFLKPVILVPLASVNQLTADQMEAVILHEICHIKSNDYLVNLFVALTETLLFFNPFVILLVKIIKKERENCCDDFVLQYQYDRHSYASALMVLEKFRIRQLPLALAATSGRKPLLVRIKRIMEAKNSIGTFNYGQKLLALLSATGVLCCIAWLLPDRERTAVSHKHILPINTETGLRADHNMQIEMRRDSARIAGLPLPSVQLKNQKVSLPGKVVIKNKKINRGELLPSEITSFKFDTQNGTSNEDLEAMGERIEHLKAKRVNDITSVKNSFFYGFKDFENMRLNIDLKKFNLEKWVKGISVYIDGAGNKNEAHPKEKHPRFEITTKDHPVFEANERIFVPDAEWYPDQTAVSQANSAISRHLQLSADAGSVVLLNNITENLVATPKHRTEIADPAVLIPAFAEVQDKIASPPLPRQPVQPSNSASHRSASRIKRQVPVIKDDQIRQFFLSEEKLSDRSALKKQNFDILLKTLVKKKVKTVIEI